MGYKKALDLLEEEDSAPKTKPTEILVEGEKLGLVAPENGKADKPDSERNATKEEINKLESRLSELEERQRDGEGVKEQLNGIDNVIAELRGELRASPAVVQGEQVLKTLEELQSRVTRVEETLEREIEAGRCPSCGSVIGWNILPAEWYNESELKPEDQSSLLPQLTKRRGKICPICGHFQEVEKESEMKEKKPAPLFDTDVLGLFRYKKQMG